jgi:hypothetical protein
MNGIDIGDESRLADGLDRSASACRLSRSEDDDVDLLRNSTQRICNLGSADDSRRTAE